MLENMDYTAIALGGLIGLLFFTVAYTFLVTKSTRGFTPDNQKQQSENESLKAMTALTNELMLALPELGGKVKKPKHDPVTESLLIRAANPWGVTVSEFKTLKFAGGFVGLLVGIPLGITLGVMTPVPWYVPIILGVLLGFYFPTSKYKDLAAKRDLEFKRQLPEALDLIHIALSGGSSFADAVESSIPNMQKGLVRTEFEMVMRDVAAGQTMFDAMEGFANRAPSDSIRTFARAIQSAIETNAPMSEILSSRAKASREEFFAYIHQKVAQLESKIWMILSPTMLPALMIISVMPSASIMAKALG